MTENLKADQKTTVLYIASPGRSGSTLMERVLNEIPSFFAAGGLGPNGHKLKKERPCICGKTLDECPVWGSIINDADFKEIDQKVFARQFHQYNREVITFFKLLFLKKRQKLPSDFKQYLNNLQIVYRTIHKHLGCQVITDSTIFPFYGYYLSLIPSIDLYVVQLVRDPKGVVYSRNKIKYTSRHVAWSPKINLLQSTFTWMKRNWLTDFLFSKKKGKFLRIHYEDFVKNPTQTLKEIGKMLGIEVEPSRFIHGNTVQLGENHLSGGNINVVEKGEIVLKLDERWKRDMRWWKIVLVSLITWPLLLKYFIFDKLMKRKRV